MIRYMREYCLKDTHITMTSNSRVFMSLDFILYGDVSLLKNWVLHYDIVSIEQVKYL